MFLMLSNTIITTPNCMHCFGFGLLSCLLGKHNNDQMKRPCQRFLTHRGMIIIKFFDNLREQIKLHRVTQSNSQSLTETKLRATLCQTLWSSVKQKKHKSLNNKTQHNYKHMKRPCQRFLTHRGMIIEARSQRSEVRGQKSEIFGCGSP